LPGSGDPSILGPDLKAHQGEKGEEKRREGKTSNGPLGVDATRCAGRSEFPKKGLEELKKQTGGRDLEEKKEEFSDPLTEQFRLDLLGKTQKSKLRCSAT
jgi:hypothetical protein